TLAQVLAGDLAELAEELHPVPLGAFLLVAVAVLAHAGGGQADGGHGHAGLGVLGFGIVAEVADQDHLVDAARHSVGSISRPERPGHTAFDYTRRSRAIARLPVGGSGDASPGVGLFTHQAYNSRTSTGGNMADDTLTPPRASLPRIQALAAADMAAVDTLIRTRLASDVILINQIAEHIVSAGGKRLRPMLVVLAGQATAGTFGTTADHHQLAATIELIHTATLLHDDVVDESDLRRGRSTADAIWANAASVLVGDFLSSRSFQLMVELDRMEVMQVLADTTNRIAEGEVLQLLHVRNPDTDEAAYLRVIERKTAVLFAAGTRLGALASNADAATQQALYDYGMALGYAFRSEERRVG